MLLVLFSLNFSFVMNFLQQALHLLCEVIDRVVPHKMFRRDLFSDVDPADFFDIEIYIFPSHLIQESIIPNVSTGTFSWNYSSEIIW